MFLGFLAQFIFTCLQPCWLFFTWAMPNSYMLSNWFFVLFSHVGMRQQMYDLGQKIVWWKGLAQKLDLVKFLLQKFTRYPIECLDTYMKY
jgi:hypothetical protein